MPVQPSNFFSGPLSPQQLNYNLYSFDGNNFDATGILFHSHRPLMAETLIASGTAYTQLSTNPVDVAGATGYTVVDTSALFGVGADLPGTYAFYHFQNYVSASAGTAGGYGGQWLTWGFPLLGAVVTPPGGVGAGMYVNSSFNTMGVFQYGDTAHDNGPWYLDLINPGWGSVNTWKPGFWWLTASNPVMQVQTNDSSGLTTRQGWLWMAVNELNGGVVGSVPTPQLSWQTVTSSALNSSVGSVLTFLNNPPTLRVSTTTGQVVPTATPTILQFTGTPTQDNYAGWSTSASNYTAQLPGLYLFCPTTVWGTVSSSGVRYSGLQVAAGGTTISHQGPAYAATPVGPGVSGVGMTGTSVVRILNLNVGDKVAFYGVQNSGGNMPLYTGQASRGIGCYMNPIAPSGSVFTYGYPNTGFRFQAGLLSGTALLAALNTHLGTDLQFLMNKPYFTGYQSTAQANLGTTGTFNKVTIDTLGALPRGGNGDNYGGWSTGNNWYASQLAGWYLVIADLYATPPASGTLGTITGGIFVSSSGSVSPINTPDQFQKVHYPVATGGPPPGVTCIGAYYLLPGETVYPAIAFQGWGASAGTYVSTSTATTVHSQFSCFWVAE